MKTLRFGHFSNIPCELLNDPATSISDHPEQGKIVQITESSEHYSKYEAERMQHELIVCESGSRKLEVTHDGDSYDTKQQSFSKELFVVAECSCGESFDDEEEAWNHVKEVAQC